MKFKSDIEVQAGLKDSSGAAGTSGQVLSSNGTTVSWINSGGGFANDVQNTVKAGVAINKGQAVYVTGADGTNIIVGLASNATEATSSKTLGLLNATVAINGFADVIQIGKLAGLDTSTAVVGDPVWLGSNGNLIYGLANKPYAPLHLVYIGVVTRVNANNGEIFINVQNGFELKEIHDVDIVSTPPLNNEILAFEGGSVNLWKNKSISSIGGITGTGTSGQVAFWNGTSSVTGSSNFTFSNDRLTINRTSDSRIFLQENGVTNLQLQAISGLSRLSSNNGNLALATAGGDRLLVFLNGNIGVNTTTDAGFRLDVNGTARVQGSINIGSSLSTISYNLPLSITLPAIGTKVAFLNVGINSVIKVELNGSENGFYQPMLLTISRNNTGASITINKDNPFFHENSNDISFSFDTATGDIYAEKIVYSTGRNFRISKVEVLFGTATVLNGTLTSTTNVGVDQTVTRIGKALYVTGVNTAAQGNLTVAQGNVLIGTATASAFRLDVLGTTRLNGLQTFQGTTASDTAPLGSELAAVTGTGTGWTLAGTNLNVGGYTHTTGDVTPLTTTLAAVSGTYYQIAYTITGRTTGSITINYGGTSKSGITTTSATGPLASSTTALTITPTTDFNGTVVLSIKSIGTSSATTTFLSSAGTASNSIRVSDISSNTFIGANAGRRNTTAGGNTFVGSSSGQSNTTGTFNTFLGQSAGAVNNIGGANTFIGYTSGTATTTGDQNTFLGSSSGAQNTSGNNNTFIGQGSGGSNTTGGSNTFLGIVAGSSNTTGAGNIAIGQQAFQSNTTGTNNVAIGNTALFGLTGTNANNVALGTNAGRYTGSGTTAMTSTGNSMYLGTLTRGLNATGSTNEIVIGYDVVGLGSNTTIIGNTSTTATAIYGDLLLGGTTDNGTDKLQVTGSASISADSAINGVNIGRGGGAITTNTRVGTIALNSNTTGSGNSAFGISALNANTTGGSNTAIGRAALEANTTGTTNTAVGTFSLLSNISGSNNVSLGFNSGRFIADGTTANTISNTSIFIGVSTKALADNQTNQIVIGHNAVGLGSNTTVLGNSSTTTTAIYGNVGIGTTTVPNTLSVGMASSTTGKGISLTSSAGVEYARFGVVNSTVDNTSFIGSISNNNFAIYANNAERMRITSGGNVGIGTTSPTHLLSVENSSSYETASFKSSSVPYQIIGNAAVGDYWRGFFTGQNIVTNATTGKPSVKVSGYTASAIAYSADSSQGYLGFFTTSSTTANTDLSERMRITSGGNVGIGTTTDAGYKLDVNGTGRFNTSLTVGAGGLAGRLSVRGTTNDSSAYSFESANSSGNSLFLVRNDGVATIANLAGTGTRLVTANASGVLSTTAGDAAPRYSSYVIVSHSSYTNICTINGDALASAIKMSFQGTSGNVVVNTTAEILVNHHQDISITSNSGFYSQLNIRIISNNNESYSVEAQVIGATTPTGLNIEVFPLNSEAVTFQGTLVTPGTTLIHTTRPGMYISATGGNQGDISASGSVYAGETMVSNGNATFGNTANRRVNYDSNGGNFRIKANAGGWAMGYFFDGSSGTYRGGYGGFGNADGLTYYWVGSDYNIPTMVVQPNQGNVMIGTTTDAGYKLDVAGTCRIQDNLRVNGGADGSYFKGGDTGVGSGIANFVDYNGTSAMFIRGDRNVGIGTTSPINGGGAAKWLTIDGTTNYSGGLVASINGNAKAYFYSQDNYAIVQGASGQGVKLMPNGAEGVTVLSGGNVGIGTTSPSAKLHVVGSAFFSSYVDLTGFVTTGNNFMSSSGGIFFKGYNNFETGILTANSGNDFLIQTGSSERMRITSGGNVLIGTTTDAGYKLDVAGTGRVTGSLTINSATTPFLYFHSTRTSGQSGYIKDDGNMVFQKTESGGGFRFLNSSSSVLLSIDSGGNSAFINSVTITPPSNQVGFTVNHSGTNGATGSKFNAAGSGFTYGAVTATFDACNYGTGIKIVTGLYSTSLGAMQFFNSTTAVGSITCTASSTAYNTSSDYRLKENVVPMESSINRLKELNPCRFNFINNPDKTVDGFIAHEVQEVIPEAITGEKDELDYDGSPKYQGIDQSKIVPLLTAALQEAISKIEALENRLSILENK